MATIYVNDKPVDIGTERLNLIQAAQRGGVFIPSYCWHPALTVVASCRMCLVEVGEKKPDGTVAMQPRVVPACQTPAKDQTVVITNSSKAKAAQQQTLEDLLLNHPLDCPVCDKAGECLLQDYSYGFGRATSRMVDDKHTPPNKPHIGEHITLFTDRCILCSRCVRFTREISGRAELEVISRGDHSEIDIFPGDPVNNKLAGNVVDICPVGALCSKDFLYKQRVWFLQSQRSVCPDCSTGCSIFVDHNKDIVYRLRPRENPQAQGHFMCDEGRFDYPYINSRQRLSQPVHRPSVGQAARLPGSLSRDREGAGEPAASGRSLTVAALNGWDAVLAALRRDLADAARRDAAATAFVLSPFLTCEEAYLLAKYAKGLSGQCRLFLGRVPVIGEDDTYPKDRKGRAVEPVKFTIRAEKCPNRRGVEEILRHFQGEVLSFDDLVKAAGARELTALYLTAGYSPRAVGQTFLSADAGAGASAGWKACPTSQWLREAEVAALRRVPLLIVQDLFASPITETAQFVLPASSFAEKDGAS